MSISETLMGINSAALDTPLNHLIWLNDYKTYGENSYVFRDKDILHELYKSVRISANDNAIYIEAFNAIIDNNYPIVGVYFGAINDIKQSDTDINWNSLTTMSAIASSETAMSAIASSETAMSVIRASNIAIGKYAVGAAGLNPVDYKDMTAVAASETAMTAVAASETAMTAVAASETAMTAVAASETAMTAIDPVINNYRTPLVNMLNSSTRFTKSSKNIGRRTSGTWTDGIATNTIYIPVSCYDGNYTSFTVYSGVNQSRSVMYVKQHLGTVSISGGVSLRGTKVVGSGGDDSNGAYVTFNVYTLNS